MTGSALRVAFDGDLIAVRERANVTQASADSRREFTLDGELEALSIGCAEARTVGALGDRLELRPIDCGAGRWKGVGELVGIDRAGVDVLVRVGECRREGYTAGSVVIGACGGKTERRRGECFERALFLGAVVVEAEASADREIVIGAGEPAEIGGRPGKAERRANSPK